MIDRCREEQPGGKKLPGGKPEPAKSFVVKQLFGELRPSNIPLTKWASVPTRKVDKNDSPTPPMR